MMSEAEEYAGDLSPRETWDLLTADAGAVLVDVRTTAEWTYVGGPDLSSLAKDVLRVEWQVFPAMAGNTHFVDAVRALGVAEDAKVALLCRSGIRSRNAAKALTAAGFQTCYNVAEGFEGDPDVAKHRGTVNGWKIRGLPWIQG